ncbi:MAG: hypothetical protein IKB75_05665 [Clostridia bacterium]|nr:hypothetical protein [Clostridia bacterium]
MSDSEKLENPWKDRDSLPSPKGEDIALAMLMLLLCALCIPFCFYDWVPPVLLAAVFSYIVYAVRKPRAVIALLLLAVIPSAFFSGLSVSALLFALVVGTGCFAYLITLCKSPYLAVLPFVFAFGIVRVILRDAEPALLTLVCIPSGLLLAIATRKALSRTVAVIMTLIGFLIPLGLILWIVLGRMASDMGVELAQCLAYIREELTAFLIAVREEFIRTMPTLMEGTDDAAGRLAQMEQTVRSVLSDAFFVDLTASLFNLLPGIAVLLCSIPAYAAQFLLAYQYAGTGMEAVVTPQSLKFIMSPTSAILFMIAFLINLFASGNSFVVAVIGNFYLMLLPAFCVVGAQSIGAILHPARGGARLFLLLLIASAICCLGVNTFSMLAFFGAYEALIYAVREKMARTVSEGGDDHNGEDPME